MSHRGDYSADKIRFCPKCGVEGLEFDRYRQDKNFCKAEYICGVCGFGFRITQSARVQHADLLFKRHRQMREGKFHEGVTAEVSEKWTAATEKRHERWYQRLLRRGTQP